MHYSLTRTSEEAWMTIIEDIRNAKHSIDCELFIIDMDDVGMYLLNALRQKSREGVRVRVLADAGGSYLFYLANTLKAELREDGIDLVFFNHLIPLYPRTIKLWYFRNHRRSIVIDGEIAYTGGVCFSKHMEGWRDTVLRVISKETASDMTQAFQRMWKLAEKKVFEKRSTPAPKEWLYLTNAPLPGKYYYYNAILELIKNAQKDIFLTSPYFVPDYMFFRALYRAQKRGVQVHLLLPLHSNHLPVDYAGDFFKERLLKKGARIYRYPPCMIHSKTSVFDDHTCSVGSMNLDNISLRYNFEGGMIIKDKECVAEVRQHFEEDIRDLSPLTLAEWHNRPFKSKIMMYLSWPLQKLL
jgi:cardiolipin synthase